MKYAIFLSLIAMVTTFLLEPFVARIARRVGAVDEPDRRKVHDGTIPRLGGVGIFGGVVVTMAVALLASDWIGHVWKTQLPNPPMVLLAVTFAVGLGAVDDVHRLSALPKATVLLALAALLFYAGVRVERITNPLTATAYELGALSLPATLFWIFLVTNAFNLIDGLDGLATGLAMVALLGFSLIALVQNQTPLLYYVAPVAGALLGFLPYNFPRRQMFLGDSGSYFVGIVLAILSIQANQKGPTAFVTFVPITFLAIPIGDVFGVMTRRLLAKERMTITERLAGMFRPDQRHIHHLLIRRGIRQTSVTALLITIGVMMSLAGLVMTVSRDRSLTVVLFVMLLVLLGVLLVSGVGETALPPTEGSSDRQKSQADSGNEPENRGG